MAASLDTLPTEILVDICSYLCEHCRESHAIKCRPDVPKGFQYEDDGETPTADLPTGLNHEAAKYMRPRTIKDLLRLCLVSRRLRKTAQTFVFHSFRHNIGFSASQCISDLRHLQLYRTITLEKPELGLDVNEIRLCIRVTRYDLIDRASLMGILETPSHTMSGDRVANLLGSPLNFEEGGVPGGNSHA
jgi:hypothetical protein